MSETTRLSQSELWARQSAFYQEHGPGAWSDATLPLYITSNPTFVRAYAEVIIGYWRDVAAACDPALPLYVFDLGCGAGRFTHGLLGVLEERFAEWRPPSPVVVVGVDVVQPNLDALRQHAMMRDAFAAGRADLALFDATADRELALWLSGARLDPTTPTNPMVFVANYLFDSLPCDMFCIERGTLLERRVATAAEPVVIEDDWSGIAVFDEPLAHPYYEDPDLEQVLRWFGEREDDGFFSIPTAGIRCWKNLHALSGGQMLMLSADKGGATLEMAFTRRANSIQHHGGGCISLTVNYRALAVVVERLGGRVLHRAEESSPLAIVALLSGEDPLDFRKTRAAYRAAIDGFGPEGFFQLKCVLEELYDQMTLQSLIAWLHLADGDPLIMLQAAPALHAMIARATPAEARAVSGLIEASWARYFPIGDALDLPFQLGRLMLELDNAERALFFFERSVELHGDHPAARCSVAQCQLQLGRAETAAQTLNAAIERYPTIVDSKMVNLLLYRIGQALGDAGSDG
ncbi:MAG: tetratricopeptide repeat protein [Myxococcales bacterium]|nr:tetratricopeptide repeat protein [Myxococcales bacterium]